MGSLWDWRAQPNTFRHTLQDSFVDLQKEIKFRIVYRACDHAMRGVD